MKILDASFLDTFVFVIVMLTYAIIKHFKNSKQAKKDKEDTKIHVSDIIETRLLNNQIKLCNDQATLLYSELYEKYCELLKINKRSIEGQLLELSLMKLRIFTDKAMLVVIHTNKFASRKGVIWEQYKEDKAKVMFSEANTYLESITSQHFINIIGKSFKELNDFLGKDTTIIYSKHMNIIFEIVRNEAISFHENGYLDLKE